MRLKEGTSKARGYCGWHTSWDNRRCYLRSLGEFVVACMLDAEERPYLTEKKIFFVDGYRYKPDFLIFGDTSYTEIVSIIEAKGQGDLISSELYQKQFGPFFEGLGISYQVIYKFDALKTKFCNKEKQQYWKNACAENSNSSSISGELNPMFGVPCSQKTRRLIGDKARERCADEEYMAMCKASQAIFWASERGALRKLELKRLRNEEKRKRDEAYALLPDIVSYCKCCNTEVLGKETADFCSKKCNIRWKKDNVEGYFKSRKGDNRYRKNVIGYIGKIRTQFGISTEEFLSDLDYYVKQAKIIKLIPKNKGISNKTLTKFNITKDDLNGEVISDKN